MGNNIMNSIHLSVFIQQPTRFLPRRNFFGFVAIGSAGGHFIKGFHGLEVGAASHKFKHFFSTLPSGDGTLIPLVFFYGILQVALRGLYLLEGGDGVAPKLQGAPNGLRFQAGEGNVHKTKIGIKK